ncbi:MAG TPA: type IV pilin protein [Rhodanobacteraceae bacterium]|nr:type IV pilin protein [Rhodanobacteraceae bacterium]
MSKHRGFTLIELMIVVVIVAILAAIAYPSYQEQIRKTRRGQAKADLMEITQALERKFTVDRDYSAPAFTWPFTKSPRDAADGSQYYDLSFEGAAGATTYTIKAVPANAQAGDRCGTLQIDNLGQKQHSAGDDDYCGWGTSP